jgi:hypothetical protein
MPARTASSCAFNACPNWRFSTTRSSGTPCSCFSRKTRPRSAIVCPHAGRHRPGLRAPPRSLSCSHASPAKSRLPRRLHSHRGDIRRFGRNPSYSLPHPRRRLQTDLSPLRRPHANPSGKFAASPAALSIPPTSGPLSNQQLTTDSPCALRRAGLSILGMKAANRGSRHTNSRKQSTTGRGNLASVCPADRPTARSRPSRSSRWECSLIEVGLTSRVRGSGPTRLGYGIISI